MTCVYCGLETGSALDRHETQSACVDQLRAALAQAESEAARLEECLGQTQGERDAWRELAQNRFLERLADPVA